MVGHTQKVDYEAAEEAETAGSLLSGTWPEVMVCGSRRCQGVSWTLQICVNGRSQKRGKYRKRKKKTTTQNNTERKVQSEIYGNVSAFPGLH